jgi:hypothetical protein
MGFEEGVDPVDGWSAPRQTLVRIATRSLPLSAQIMSAAFSAIMMVSAFVYAGVMVSMIDGAELSQTQARGHPATPLPRSAMNSRRLMGAYPPRLRITNQL